MITETLTTHLKKNETFVSGSGSVDATPRHLGVLADPDGATRGGGVVWKRWRMDGPTREHPLKHDDRLRSGGRNTVTVELGAERYDPFAEETTRRPLPAEYFFPYDD